MGISNFPLLSQSDHSLCRKTTTLAVAKENRKLSKMADRQNCSRRKYFSMDIDSDLAAQLDSITNDYESVTSRDPDEDEIEEELPANSKDFINEYDDDDSSSNITVMEKKNMSTSSENANSSGHASHWHSIICPKGDEGQSSEGFPAPNFACKCNCFQKFDISYISNQLSYNQSMTKSELDLVVMGRISSLISVGATHGPKHKHKEVPRIKSRCEFRYHSKLCFISVCFKTIFIITKPTDSSYKK